MDVLLGGLLTLSGVVAGFLIDLIRDERKATRAKEAKRFEVEYESMRELADLLPTFSARNQDADTLEERKTRAVALAFRVRDDRPRRAVEPLVSLPLGDEWYDRVGNAVRIVGEVMRDL